MPTFQVQEAAFVVEDAVATLAWRLGDDDEESFMISAAQSHGDQDRRSGTDTYCLIGPGPTFATCYGGVEQYSWVAAQLRIVLTPAARNLLGVQEDLTLRFINPQDEELTRRHLPRLVEQT